MTYYFSFEPFEIDGEEIDILTPICLDGNFAIFDFSETRTETSEKERLCIQENCKRINKAVYDELKKYEDRLIYIRDESFGKARDYGSAPETGIRGLNIHTDRDIIQKSLELDDEVNSFLKDKVFGVTAPYYMAMLGYTDLAKVTCAKNGNTEDFLLDIRREPNRTAFTEEEGKVSIYCPVSHLKDIKSKAYNYMAEIKTEIIVPVKEEKKERDYGKEI